MAAVPFLLMVLLASGCDATPQALKDQARQRWVREAGVESFNPEGGAPLAGVSARRRITVEPLQRRDVGPDTSSQAFHRFVHRCSACHEPPSPAAHTPREWGIVVRRMVMRADSAGLLPIGAQERHEILGFLGRHARDR